MGVYLKNAVVKSASLTNVGRYSYPAKVRERGSVICVPGTSVIMAVASYLTRIT